MNCSEMFHCDIMGSEPALNVAATCCYIKFPRVCLSFGDLFACKFDITSTAAGFRSFLRFCHTGVSNSPASLLSSEQIVISRLLVRARDYCTIISWVIKESSITIIYYTFRNKTCYYWLTSQTLKCTVPVLRCDWFTLSKRPRYPR